jgi:cellulose biosynthesis protein BcsQ
LGYIKQADIIIVPFVPNYIDLQVIIPWYNSLTWEQKKKVFFLPNRYQKTKEQKDGLEQLESETGRDEKTGKEMKLAKEKKKQLSKVLSPLSSRPALYGSILNGSKKNFFTNRSNSNQAEEIFIELFKKYEKNKKSNKSY